MNREAIFINKEIPCPVCQLLSPLRYPNPRYYVAASRESDMHVTSYKWNRSGCEGIWPHYYAVWQCPVCMFADLAEKIEKPEGKPKDDILREAFINIPDEKRFALQQLRRLVGPGELDFNGAVALHQSAVLTNLLPAQGDRNHDKLGRLALRLGWLFRERSGKTEEVQIKDETFSKLFDEVARLESQILALMEVLSDVERAAADRLNELGLSTDSKDDPYISVARSFSEKVEEMKPLLLMMHRSLLYDQRGQLKGSKEGKAAAPSDLDEFLLSLKEHWPELPVNEEQSLFVAVDAYEYSYNHESTYLSIEQSISVLSLLVDMMSRTGDYERALKWIAEVYNSGVVYKSELRNRITIGQRTKRLRAHEEESLRRKISNIDLAIAQAGESRRRIMDSLVEKFDPITQEVLKASEDLPMADREKLLAKAGVPEEVISQIKLRKMMRERKKGRLFGR